MRDTPLGQGWEAEVRTQFAQVGASRCEWRAKSPEEIQGAETTVVREGRINFRAAGAWRTLLRVQLAEQIRPR